MPREKSKSRTELVETAMNIFWSRGYHVVSVGDLVRDTGVSRAGIYADFAGKEALFHACLDRYQDMFTSRFLAPLEAPDAGLNEMEEYLEKLVNGFETSEGKGPGCLVANTLGQIDGTEAETLAKVNGFYDLLRMTFSKAIVNDNHAGCLSAAEVSSLADFALISVQGLCLFSRTTDDIALMRNHCATLMSVLRSRVGGALQ